MSRMEDISKMNLAELDSPYGDNSPVETPEAGEAGQIREPAEGQEGSEAPVSTAADSEKEDRQETRPGQGGTQEHMAQPTGTHYYVDAHIGKEELGPFVRNHLMKSPSMLILALIGTGMLVYSLVFNRGNLMLSLLYFVLAVVVFPFFQYSRVMKMNLSNPYYANALHYMLDEWGFHLEAGGHAMDVEWKYFIRKKKCGPSYVLYTGKANAYLLPEKDLGDRKEEILSFIDSHLGEV